MTDVTPDEAAEWHRVAEERRRQLERLQGQALFRIAAASVARGRRVAGRFREVADPARDAAVRIARSAVAAPERLRAPARIAALHAAVAALPPAPAGAAQRTDVTAVIVTASQPVRLDALLAALGRLGVATLVVDNAGVPENAVVVARHPHVRRLRLEQPVRYAAANEHAIAEVATPWVLLLNDDVLPVDDHWLDRMLVAADDGTVAVGAQLVHGRRGPLGGDAVDGTVQHAGVALHLDGPLVRAVHLARGAQPTVRDEVREVDAATAACLLVRTEAHRAVGGFHTGFDYGSEDVDLCLRLAAHGALRVALGAVLEHEEGATRLARRSGADRRARTARQSANRALLDARHAPALRHRVVRAVLGDADAAPRTGRRGASLTVTTLGPVPGLLHELADGTPGLVLAQRGEGALVLVSDPRRLPARGAPSPGVPVVAWVDAPQGAQGAWTADALARVDAVLVAGRAASDGRPPAPLDDPTLPVRSVRDTAAVRDAIRDVLVAPRWTLRTGAPGGRAATRWGDTTVADALARELRAHGVVARTVGRDGWGSAVDRAADVTLHLKGRGVAPVADAQTNIVWVMSHPSEVAPGELDAADLVLAGSALLAERYRTRTTSPVVVLPQAADARRFTAGPRDPAVASRVLFVGNTRSIARPAVLGALDAGLPLTLVGAGWERYVDPSLVAREHVPYDELATWYRSADVVLNDHWDDMARWGLISNRVFDVLACGGSVVSDEVPGMAELLDDGVRTFHDRGDVGAAVRALLADPDERAARAERGRRAVLAAHTWEHRAATLLALVAERTR